MKKQAAGSEKAFFSKSGTSCNIQDRRLWENGWGWSHCLNREELQCPSVQAQRPTPPAERCDYLYFRPDFTATDPNRLILIDKPENHGGQYRNRGYAAGHAEPDTVDDQGPIW
jgi:hypothetical protein